MKYITREKTYEIVGFEEDINGVIYVRTIVTRHHPETQNVTEYDTRSLAIEGDK